MSERLPLACKMTNMSDRERKQHHRAAKDVFSAVQELREHANGYAFRLPTKAPLIRQAGAFISRERLCCPFFDFTLGVTADHGPVWLSISGKGDVKQFLKENLLDRLDGNVETNLDRPAGEHWSTQDLPDEA